MIYDIVIIGNSAAAISAVNTIRKYNSSLSIALIDRENTKAYSRVLTPYYISGKTDVNGLFMVDEHYYNKNKVTTYFGSEATFIDRNKHGVHLSNGKILQYKMLLIANGAEAIKIGFKSDNISNLRHLNDAIKLRKYFLRSKIVAGFGAGLVTIPMMSHFDDNVKKYLIISSNRILSRLLDNESSEIIENSLVKRGLHIYKKENIESIENNNDKIIINLSSGVNLLSDCLIVGKGVKPNTELARDSGINIDSGVLIDEYCRTNDPDIYAAGDVAEGFEFATNRKIIQGNWLTAVEQAEIAAKNMLGQKVAYEGSIKCNITKIFGVGVAVIGIIDDDIYESEKNYNPLTDTYRKYYIDDAGKLKGVVMINNTDEAGIYYGLIKLNMLYRNIIKHKNGLNYSKVLKYLDYK
jgi:NAD(P)H-nitrite reductase large subunit